jgi:hypothetical protein
MFTAWIKAFIWGIPHGFATGSMDGAAEELTRTPPVFWIDMDVVPITR